MEEQQEGQQEGQQEEGASDLEASAPNTELITYRQALHTAINQYPYVLSRGSVAVNNIFNGIVIGAIGGSAVASGPIISTMTTTTMGLVRGSLLSTSILVRGLEEPERRGELVWHGWILSAVYSVPVMVTFAMSEQIISLLGLSSDIARETGRYFRPFTFAVLPILWNTVDQQYALGSGHAKVTLVMGLSYAVIGMGVGYPLGLGWFGTELGLSGMAWGTVVAAWVNLVSLRLYFAVRRAEYRNDYLFSFPQVKLSYFLGLLKVGFPLGIQRVIEWGNLALISLLLGELSTDALSASAPSFPILTAYNLVIQGFAQAIGVSVTEEMKHHGNSIHMTNARRKSHMSFAVAFGVSAGAAALTTGLSKPICKLFLDPTNEDYEEILTQAQAMLIINSVALLLEPARNMYGGALRGMKDVVFAPMIGFITMTLIGLSAGGGLTYFLDWGEGWLFITRDVGIIMAAIAIAHRWLAATNTEQPRNIEDSEILTQRVQDDSYAARCPYNFFPCLRSEGTDPTPTGRLAPYQGNITIND